ncbi:MAG: acyl-CoA dehydratase activase [Calditrichota bacterium]
MNLRYHIGIDVGSRTTKAVLLRGDQIIARAVRTSKWDTQSVVREVLRELTVDSDCGAGVSAGQNNIGVGSTCKNNSGAGIPARPKNNGVGVPTLHNNSGAGVSARQLLSEADIRIFATGYGRNAVPGAARTVTEITCHARGAWFLHKGVRSVIDIGGQDAKVINLDASGFPCDFAMNDRCAAGTGRFLEFMALALEMSVEELARRGLDSDSGARISSMCTVFAESEMLSLRAAGTPLPDVISGLHAAIARRIASLAGQIGIREPVLFTGGVAQNPAMVKALAETLNLRLIVPPEPVLVGALGAALLSREECI